MKMPTSSEHGKNEDVEIFVALSQCNYNGKLVVWDSNPDTLPETNIAPENGQSEKETNIPTIHF